MSSTINALSITSFTIDPSFWANAPAGQPNEKAPDTGADTLPPDGSPPPRHQYSPAPANILAQLQKQSGGAQPRQGQGADGTALEARRYGDTSVVTGPGNYLGDTQPQPAPGESDRTQAIVKKYPDGSFTRERDGQVTLFKKVPGGYNVHKPDGSIAFTENPHEQWLDGALQRNSRNGEIILARQAQQAAEQAAREQRQGLGGAVRGVNKALSNLAKTPENLYKSVRDQGLAKTIDDMAVGYLSMPFDIAHAISDKDMQTLTASALALGLRKVPGRTAAGKLERTAAESARALEQAGAKGVAAAESTAIRFTRNGHPLLAEVKYETGTAHLLKDVKPPAVGKREVVTHSYENPGAHGGGGSAPYDATKSVLPANHVELFKQSVPFVNGEGKVVRYAIDKKDGSIHRFDPSSEGTYHWNGSSNGVTKSGKPWPLYVPNEVMKVLNGN